MFTTDRRPDPGHKQRLIIAIDLDAFYLSVERLRDPSLHGVPVGVVQKSLLATTSYEARALGVGKLISIKRALEICPTLRLVNGEDLTPYRAYSKRVRDLVNGLLLPEHGVEKLGLDEVRSPGYQYRRCADEPACRCFWMSPSWSTGISPLRLCTPGLLLPISRGQRSDLRDPIKTFT